MIQRTLSTLYTNPLQCFLYLLLQNKQSGFRRILVVFLIREIIAMHHVFVWESTEEGATRYTTTCWKSYDLLKMTTFCTRDSSLHLPTTLMRYRLKHILHSEWLCIILGRCGSLSVHANNLYIQHDNELHNNYGSVQWENGTLSAPSTVYNTQLVQDPKNLSAFNNYVINRMMVH